jgi:hypothetical protein
LSDTSVEGPEGLLSFDKEYWGNKKENRFEIKVANELIREPPIMIVGAVSPEDIIIRCFVWSVGTDSMTIDHGLLGMLKLAIEDETKVWTTELIKNIRAVAVKILDLTREFEPKD